MTSVLIVEDEFLIAEDLKSSLEAMGYKVIGMAPSCAAALEAIWAEKPDLAFVDTRLGNETCEAVLDECALSGVPVIIASGHSHVPEYAGGRPVLHKPFNDATIRDVLISWQATSTAQSAGE